MSTRQGTVTLTRYAGGRLEEPVAEAVRNSAGGGSRCVLTTTNQEALCVLTLLRSKGISARLIQSNDGFDLYHLAELRYFLKRLKGEGPVLDEALWQKAKEALKRVYQRSTCLPLCLKILETWESINSTKYRNDLELFLHESKLEDFYEETEGTVCVSTLHKSKGREFDRVWLLLNRYDFSTDERKRAVYVGMTRAKSELHIHTDSTFFDTLLPQGIQRKVEERVYPEPDELLLELTHRDVVLDYFKDKKRLILSLKSGDRLNLAGSYL